MDNNNFYLVREDALPDTFFKVLAAKRLLSTGEAETASMAAKMAGLSRSAFYKYKDSVFLFNENEGESIVTVYAVLEDVSGVLSKFINKLNTLNANILTINQGAPRNGVADVTVSFRTQKADKCDKIEELLKSVEGVVSVKLSAKGELK